MKKIFLTILVLVLLLAAFYVLFPGKVLNLFIGMERSAAGLEKKSVVVDGDNWVYLEGGDGEPLVLVHGFGADKDNWVYVARSLTPHYRVIVPDLLGFGETDKPTDREYLILKQSEYLRGFVQALGLKRIHLGGNSMGGAISIVYAARWADEVASLWLLNPGGVMTRARSEMGRMVQEEGRNPLVVDSAGDIERLMNFTMSNPPPLPPLMAREIGKRALASREMNDRVFVDVGRDIAINVMTGSEVIRAPTLIVWGEEDRVLHPDGASILDQRIPNSRLIMMSGTGHLPMIEFPEQAARDYLAFRKSLSATTSPFPAPVTNR